MALGHVSSTRQDADRFLWMGAKLAVIGVFFVWLTYHVGHTLTSHPTERLALCTACILACGFSIAFAAYAARRGIYLGQDY